MQEQCTFYGKTLGLKTEFEQGILRVFLPESELIFTEATKNTAYHVAFNIPENQIEEALQWLKDRCDIIPDETGNVIVDFSNWNSHAVYFLDAAQNILELIARHDMNNASDRNFSADSILCISEVGCCSNHIQDNFEILNTELGIQKYSGNFERFCAAGDENGLVILVPENRNWYPTSFPCSPAPFQAQISNGSMKSKLVFSKGKISLTKR